jgi:hypothetical protein
MNQRAFAGMTNQWAFPGMTNQWAFAGMTNGVCKRCPPWSSVTSVVKVLLLFFHPTSTN